MNTSLGKLTKVTASQAAGQNKKIKGDKAKFDQTLNQLQPASQLATTNLLQNQQANNSLSADKQMSTDDVATSKLKKLSNLVTIQSVTGSTEPTKTKSSSIVNVNRLADVVSTLNDIDKRQTTDASTSFQLPTSVKENSQLVTDMQEPLSRSTVVTDQPTTSPIINDSVAAKQAADLMTNTTQPTTVKENSQLVTDMQEPLSRLTVVTDQPTTSPIVSNSVAAKQAADLTANTTQPTTVKGNAQSVATVQEPLSPATISTSQPITSPIINDSVAAKQMADLTANTTQPTTVKESAEPVTTLQAAKIMDSVDTKQKEVATDPALELVGSDISQQATSLVSQNSLNNFNTTDKSVESKDTTINMGIAGKVVTSKTDSKSLNLLTNTIETANSFVGNNNPLMDTTGATKQSFVWNTTNSAGQSQLVDNLAKEVSTMNIPGSKTVTIKLSPENLGNVEITMKTAQSQVSLAVKVQNTAAKELLGSVMDKLEQVLQNQPYSTDGSIGLKNANPVNQPNLTTAANTFFNFNSSQQQFAHQQPQHNFVGTSSKFANDTKKQTAEVQQHDLRKSTISILA
ncbi:MAG: flagellar hook-length control protein FliK [Liquorilactobacillus nagelii]|jgi:hypothetical protein|uniref:Flagellar hook-length control protein-like C-terminal domain-containing protein n=3 Tax=Liquorilactobacillus nagelii TaxID=82688 RepID=A0A3Q8CDB6_9LACO|nr:flagellar hook-length control protein FliK [Liquorilactobacillus nagelii]AUJ33049.1 hypothetical protein BSQ50_11130 [Liquorilactobacillus nagelii]MCC7616656.1 hypothetical protein [Liquorilactobacillus nagelii]MCI1700085.1 flagellar hook-length control protein FliK [Liquorilactobacillus nagelii]MCI1920781.1 flagellar hook-length control protein FliK [Liquorilactobacillus nagelii]MCI1976887.1 flagellar hook-length control protein FliK [Liquorilactobacillus nagelii]